MSGVIAALAATATIIHGMARRAPDREYIEGPEGRFARIHVVGPLSCGSDSWWEGVDTYALASAIIDEARLGVPVELSIDSPGGSVVGMDDLLAAIAEARTMVPVSAYARGSCQSAALWAAVACSPFRASPLAVIGSVGIIFIDREGAAPGTVRVTNTGASLKGLGAAEAPEMFAAIANANAAIFHQTIADGRGLTLDDAIGRFGDGRVYSAQEALGLGLIDEVAGATREVLEMTTKARAEGMPPTDAPPAEMSEIDILRQKLKEAEEAKAAAEAAAEAAKATTAKAMEDAEIEGLCASGKLQRNQEADARAMYAMGAKAFEIYKRSLVAAASAPPTERASSGNAPPAAVGPRNAESFRQDVIKNAKANGVSFKTQFKREVRAM